MARISSSHPVHFPENQWWLIRNPNITRGFQEGYNPDGDPIVANGSLASEGPLELELEKVLNTLDIDESLNLTVYTDEQGQIFINPAEREAKLAQARSNGTQAADVSQVLREEVKLLFSNKHTAIENCTNESNTV